MVVVIIPEAKPIIPDPSLVAASHQMKPVLAVGQECKAGTPLRSTPAGWVVAGPDGVGAQCVAAQQSYGGEKVNGWRIATLDYGVQGKFKPSATYRIADIDDRGNLLFAEAGDGEGGYLALSDRQILLDFSR